MALATVGRDGQPSARLVLLKDVDARGFTFYTNYESRKAARSGGQRSRQPAVLLALARSAGARSKDGWTRSPAAESDAYFASRPLESRWSAYASPQSRPVASRDELEARVDDVRQRFGDAVPRPAVMGRLSPDARTRSSSGRGGRTDSTIASRYERHDGGRGVA